MSNKGQTQREGFDMLYDFLQASGHTDLLADLHKIPDAGRVMLVNYLRSFHEPVEFVATNQQATQIVVSDVSNFIQGNNFTPRTAKYNY